MTWLNEPREWKAQGGNLSFVTEDTTDFWQATYYGWRNDNGHFYHQEVEGDFTAEVTFSADYKAHYDQAGLMLRSGPGTWVKAGVEFAHGRATLSSVFTQELSDWAIGPQVQPSDRIHLRLTLARNAVCVQWKDGAKFQTLRLGAFAATSNALIGGLWLVHPHKAASKFTSRTSELGLPSVSRARFSSPAPTSRSCAVPHGASPHRRKP